MGNCYSKNTTGTRTASESKTSKHKQKNSEQNRKQNAEELSPEMVPLKDDENDDSPNTRTSRLFSYDLVPDISFVKHLDHSIAPSDSGIESIGTWQDDSQGSARLRQLDSDLLKHSEQHNLSFCHKCGQYKLQGHSVLTDSNILCSPDQTEEPAGNSPLTHGLSVNKRTLPGGNSECESNVRVMADHAKNGAIGGSRIVNYTSSSEQKSGLDMSNSVGRDRHLIVSLRSAKRSSKIANGNKFCDAIFDGFNGTQAPLAQHDPSDRPVSDTLDDTISKQQALLNDILFTAETVCACDCDADDHGKCCVVSEEIEYAVKSTIHSEQVGEEDDLHHANMEASSLSSDGSFVCHNEVNNETPAKLASPDISKPIPASKERNTSHHHRSSFSESTSGVCTHKTTSGSLLISRQTDPQQGSVLLEAVLGDSSSECGEYGTEDDMTSLDMDNISRFTSQSSSSFRQLIASSEDLTSPFTSNQPTGDDERDCVLIPQEFYHQMQTDLSVLREQLLCLSSLIELSESEDQNNDSMADTSY